MPGSRKFRHRPLLEWGSKWRKSEAKQYRPTEERRAVEDQYGRPGAPEFDWDTPVGGDRR